MFDVDNNESGEPGMDERNFVLIADDEQCIRKLSSKILSSDGFETLLADNGEKAIEIYRENHHNIILVVLDIRMPGRSGVDVLKQISEINPGVRVIFCSGYGDEDLPIKDNDIFIQKPFSIDPFREAVRRVLNMSSEEIRKNNDEVLSFKPPEGNYFEPKTFRDMGFE